MHISPNVWHSASSKSTCYSWMFRILSPAVLVLWLPPCVTNLPSHQHGARALTKFFLCYCLRPEYPDHTIQIWVDENLKLPINTEQSENCVILFTYHTLHWTSCTFLRQRSSTASCSLSFAVRSTEFSVLFIDRLLFRTQTSFWNVANNFTCARDNSTSHGRPIFSGELFGYCIVCATRKFSHYWTADGSRK